MAERRDAPWSTRSDLPVISHEEDEDKADIKETSSMSKATLLAPAAPTPRCPCLIVVCGKKSAGKLYRVRGEMLVGRAVGADIVLQEAGVSRQHAKFTALPDNSVLVTDLGSSNGVFFKNSKVTSQKITDGDRIQLGDAVLVLLLMDDVGSVLHDNLFHSATADAVTRLPNRRNFIPALRKELGFANRYRVPLTLLLFSIDRYQAIQDSHGEAACDFVVRRLAQTLTELVRAEGTLLARIADDELALLVSDIGVDDARTCAEWVRRAAESETFVHESVRIPVTVSGGVARSDAGRFTNAEEFLEAARQRLYRAKMAGRNRVEA